MFRPSSEAQVLESRLVLTPLVALTSNNELVTFDSETPETIQSQTAVTGLQRRESLIGMDVRPATGQLYAVSDAGRIYTLDPATGVATCQADLVADAADDSSPFTKLKGRSFGVDFNPTVDRLRVTSDADLNLRINVDTGATITDGTLAFADGDANRRSPNVGGSAYLNPDNDPATGTMLLDIDVKRGVLVVQNPANDGVLSTVGSLGLKFKPQIGFDVTASGEALAALTPKGRGFNGRDSSLYLIDQSTGQATEIGQIGDGHTILSLAAFVPTQSIYGVTPDNDLVSFSAARPEVLTSSTPVTGLAEGETIEGIDFRPATGVLFAVGSTGNVYTIDTATGAATAIPTLAADPGDMTEPFAGLFGMDLGFDFNPAVDRLRVTSNADENLRVNVDTGLTFTDGILAFLAGDVNEEAEPNVVASAYSNNVAGTMTTSLYGIDSELDILVLQNPANAGTLTTIGGLGFDVSDVASFDITATGLAYAALTLANEMTTGFYSIDLTTGAATLIGTIGATTNGGVTLNAMAAQNAVSDVPVI